ncbi:MAG: carboxypeptidase regulatory-like domain-containing protein [Fibrobacteria bacterium]|nr:carboxypeptidase regulatory-like domain-containing protein [Fibrobacteria bacterium]
MKLLHFFVFVLLGCVFLTCSDNVTSSVNGGSTADGEAFSGRAVYDDGEVVAGAKVRLRPAYYVSGPVLEKKASFEIDTVTGSDGTFKLPGISPGEYMLEIHDGTDKAIALKLSSSGKDQTSELGDQLLTLTSTIAGNIQEAKTEAGKTGPVTVMLYGLDYFSISDSAGNFEIQGVPEGVYNIKIQAASVDFLPVDFDSVSVKAGSSAILSDVNLVSAVCGENCRQKDSGLMLEESYLLYVDYYSGDMETTSPKTDANNGLAGDNPFFQRHNVTVAHWYAGRHYWRNTGCPGMGCPDDTLENWVKYVPPVDSLGKGIYEITTWYRWAESERADYPVLHIVYRADGSADTIKVQYVEVEGYVQVNLGEHDLGEDSYVQVVNPGIKPVTYCDMVFTLKKWKP